MSIVSPFASDGHLKAFTKHMEGYAAASIEVALHARVEARDVPGAPRGTVDAEILYGDGRTAALEVTSVEHRTIWYLRAKIDAKGSEPAPGARSWWMRPESVEELERLERIHLRLIAVLEAHGVDNPMELPGQVVFGDADLEWIAWGAPLRMMGHDPGTPGPKIYWEHRMESAVFGSEGEAIAEGVADVLERDENVRKHLDKLLADPHEERHLFLGVGSTGLTNAAAFALVQPSELPDADPAMPEGIDHLWLGPGWGNTVTVWSRGRGWRNEWVTDAPRPERVD